MTIRPPSKREILNTASVIALVSCVFAVYRSVYQAPFYFEIVMSSSQPVNAQLFYDISHGFNEPDSARVTQNKANVVSVLRFPLPAATYHSFRFDPADGGGLSIVIRDTRIVDLWGSVVAHFRPQQLQQPHDIAQMEVHDDEAVLKLSSENIDPNVTINLASPMILSGSKAARLASAAREFALTFLLLCLLAACWLLFVPRQRSISSLLFVGLLAFVLLLAWKRFFAPLSWDEELFIWQGWMVKNGSVPYRDFFEPKPPLIFFSNALGLALFGLQGNVFRIIPTVVAISAVLLFQLAMLRQRILPWLATLLSAQAALWLIGPEFHDTGLNDTETYGFAFTLLGFSCGLLSTHDISKPRKLTLQIVSGICFGLAVSSKELFVAATVPAWFLAGLCGQNGKLALRQLAASAVGVLFVATVILGYLVSHSALSAYVELVRYYRPMAANFCMDIGRFPRVTGFAVIRECLSMLHGSLYNGGHLAFIIALWIASVCLPHRLAWPTRGIVLAVAGGAALAGMVAISIGYCFWKHYFLLGATGLLLPAVIGAEGATHYLLKQRLWIRASALAALAVLFVFVGWPTCLTVIRETRSGLPLDPLAVQTIEAHSKPGDYILSTESPYIYAATNRRSPLGVCGLIDVVLPYTAAIPMLRLDSLREQLEEHVPKVCYFASWMRPRQQTLHKLLFDPFLAEHHYVRVSDRLWYLPD